MEFTLILSGKTEQEGSEMTSLNRGRYDDVPVHSGIASLFNLQRLGLLILSDIQLILLSGSWSSSISSTLWLTI